MRITYKPEVCDCHGGCGQTKTYLMTMDAGAADIVRAVAVAIRNKGENEIHPRKEMELGKNQLPYDEMIRAGHMTSGMVGNLSKARSQGLIARVAGKSGHYCLTHKGSEFLKGASIPKYAIISKVTGHQEGYWREAEERVTMKQLLKSENYWEIDFSIADKAVIFNPQKSMAFSF